MELEATLGGADSEAVATLEAGVAAEAGGAGVELEADATLGAATSLI